MQITVICVVSLFFCFNDTATTEIYTLSLHDALPIYVDGIQGTHTSHLIRLMRRTFAFRKTDPRSAHKVVQHRPILIDRKSTRLNSSHANISYAVFCLKKKKTSTPIYTLQVRNIIVLA